MLKYYMLFILLPVFGFSQKVDIQKDEYGDYGYQEIIEVNGATSNELYNKAIEWIAINYEVANIELDSEEKGKIIFKGVINTNCIDDAECKIDYALILDIKDSKLRVSAKNFNYSSIGLGDTSFSSKILFKKRLIKIANKNLELTIGRLRNTLKSKTGTKEKDW